MKKETRASNKQEFIRKKKIRSRLVTSFIIFTIIMGLPTILVGIYLENMAILLGASIIYIIVNIGLGIQYLFSWRCPSCNKLLSRDIHIQYCQYCGEELA